VIQHINTQIKNPNLFHSKMIRTLARLAPRRNVAPVAGRARRATNMGDTKKVKKKPIDSNNNSGTNNAAAATSASPSKSPPIVVEKSFFQRNKLGVASMLWSFVMFFMGIQVLRAKYGEDDAKEEKKKVEDELNNLKKSLHPETSAWWDEMIKEAKLTPTQQKILSSSLLSMLVYGETLTVVGSSGGDGGDGGGGGGGSSSSSGGDSKQAVRMI
jgi:uncharacterized membrane protein YgcG